MDAMRTQVIRHSRSRLTLTSFIMTFYNDNVNPLRLLFVTNTNQYSINFILNNYLQFNDLI